MTHIKDALLDAMLPHIPFDGWSEAALNAAAREISASQEDVKTAFPKGAAQALSYHSERADAQMSTSLENDYSMETMKIRERIATAVMVRLEQNVAHKDAIRKGISHFNMPWNAPEGLRLLGKTVDAMWIAAGDDSTDYNWYTKRALLAKVYTTTLYFWLNDESENHADTRDFLHRRIDDVMQIQKVKGKAEKWLSNLPHFFSAPAPKKH